MRNYWYSLLILSFTLGLAGCGGDGDDFDESYNENKGRWVVESLEKQDTKTIEKYIDPNLYIQHNPDYPDGRQALIDAMQSGALNGTDVRVYRVFSDGDLVVVHTDYVLGGVPTIGFDVFRIENDLIVEHWDNLQDEIEPTASGRTMIDGYISVRDGDKREENKALVTRFVTEVLIQENEDNLASYFDGDDYIQHSPDVADGVAAFSQARSDLKQQGIDVNYTTLHKVIGEGNFVLTMIEGDIDGTPTAFYDLFRVDDGRLAEHWDVVADIPPANEWANPNGKF